MPVRWAQSARAASAWLRATVGVALGRQRDRIALLAPVAFGGGMAAWFGGVARAGAPFLVLLAVAFATLALAVRFSSGGTSPRLAALRGAAALLCAAGAVVAAGGAVAALRVQARAAPRLAHPVGPVAVTGWVEAELPGQRGPRFVVRVAEIEGGVRLTRVQISASSGPGPGRATRCIVVLRPPAPPLAPHAFDPQFRAYFDQVGAVGFALGRCRPTTLPQPGAAVDRWTLRLAAMRRDLADTVAAAAPGRGGGIAAALIAGDSSFVDADASTALRDSGLAHLLSVSGLHMSLVAGMTFAAVTLVVALAPPLALRVPARKVGAVAALGAGAAYLVITGASVPAERAFVMTAVAFGAVLLDRPAITMRGLALAAMVVLARRPESVLDPGFQMSFAATGALVAWYEAAQRRSPKAASTLWVVRAADAVGAFVAADLVTTLVAGTATDPFVLFHFGRFTTYAALANLAAGPIVAFIVAPAAGVAAAAAPFGLADAPLQVMAGGLDLVVAIGAVFAARPEAVVPITPPPASAFALAVSALVWAVVCRGWPRAFAIGPAGVAVVLTLVAPQPVLFVRDDGRLVFARVAEGAPGRDATPAWRAILPRRGGAFARDRLAALAGLDPRSAATLAEPDGCAMTTACLWRSPRGLRIAWAPDTAAAVRFCSTADLVIAPSPALPVKRRAGTHTPGVRLAPDGIAHHSVEADAPPDLGGSTAATVKTAAAAVSASAAGRGEVSDLRCRAQLIRPVDDGRGGYAVMDGARPSIRRGREANDVAAPWARPGRAGLAEGAKGSAG